MTIFIAKWKFSVITEFISDTDVTLMFILKSGTIRQTWRLIFVIFAGAREIISAST